MVHLLAVHRGGFEGKVIFTIDTFQSWTEPVIVCAYLTSFTLAGFFE
jgi:hypothetical protein